ncbi:Ger(x)C family spore germination protein [Desmospora profundinema]|uniref:Ger(X)C family germination protein n=1 Tax=Desmospora profundinema TaxID=1571184 RepID=A0ABU1IL04_9BACL|nr:Ger(x)C family spore germination protein [Desmospora profundinema]MDR6225466.1 Ger(x)C family germination protein [Desmospora profundinema]
MRKGICWLMITSILLLLPGCWDQDLLKDARLMTALAFDRAPGGKLMQTVVIRDMPQAEQGEPISEVHSAIGDTSRDSTRSLEKKIAGSYRVYKAQVVLMGKSLAKTDIYPYLDVLYRDPKDPIYAKLVVVGGKGADILRMKKAGNLLIGEFLFQHVKSKEELSIVPEESLESIRPIMLDPGRDFILPYIEKKGDEIIADRSAMFHGHRFTGTLDTEESTLYLLGMGKEGTVARFTEKVNPGKSSNPANYITIDVAKAKHQLKVKVRPDGEIDATIELDLDVAVPEYPPNNLDDEKEVERLNEALSKALTKKAENMIRKMQKARCDAFGVGRQLIAYHPEVWKKKKWSRDYPKVRFHSKVKVEITGSGIIS